MSATESVTGETLPQGGVWTFDPAHSHVNFSARHLGLSKVRGHFESFGCTLEIADDPAESQVDVTIDAGSITTGEQRRDDHLRSADFLDVERYPSLRFRSTSISRAGDAWQMTGDLTIRDVTRPVTVDVEYLGMNEDPFGVGTRVGFEGSTQINRHDFGLTWQGPQQAGGILVGEKVKIEVDVEFYKA